MNIFPLDRRPDRAAHFLTDMHVLHSRMEVARVVSAAAKRLGINVDGLPTKGIPERNCWVDWALSTGTNTNWLYVYYLSLEDEMITRRLTFSREEMSKLRHPLREAVDAVEVAVGTRDAATGPEFFPRLVPKWYWTHIDSDPLASAIVSYRNYYYNEKARYNRDTKYSRSASPPGFLNSMDSMGVEGYEVSLTLPNGSSKKIVVDGYVNDKEIGYDIKEVLVSVVDGRQVLTYTDRHGATYDV